MVELTFTTYLPTYVCYLKVRRFHYIITLFFFSVVVERLTRRNVAEKCNAHGGGYLLFL
jgi:hypothetical protein